MAKYQKGQSGNPNGRPKGSTNEKTAYIRDWVISVIGSNGQRLAQNFPHLSRKEQWRDTFYRVLIEKTFAALKVGGIFCLQVGSQRYPLLDDGIKIAEETLFEVLEVRPTEMVNNQTKTDEEKGEVVIILKK